MAKEQYLGNDNFGLIDRGRRRAILVLTVSTVLLWSSFLRSYLAQADQVLISRQNYLSYFPFFSSPYFQSVTAFPW
jgi:hypothetical protein